jgi:hypothetical protein
LSSTTKADVGSSQSMGGSQVSWTMNSKVRSSDNTMTEKAESILSRPDGFSTYVTRKAPFIKFF